MRYAGGVPNDSERTPKQQRAAKRRNDLIRGVLLLGLSFLPFIDRSDNPRVAALHGIDLLKLFAAGMLFGIGLTSLISALFVSRSE